MVRNVFIYSLFIGLFSVNASAQLSVNTTANANTLVNTIVGGGAIVTNVTLNCNPNATATFTTSGGNLGLSSGIILATGKAVQAVGPNNSTGDYSPFGNNPQCFNSQASFFDANLSSISPNATFDGCALEFDIKPACTVLKIDYVFASEEYPEYVCGDVNDAFGFFISGPNPSGGNYNGYNIARLPDGTGVSINSVNGGSPGSSVAPPYNCTSLSNAAYYVDNSGGSTIQYDGFTVPLTAAVNVQECATYHLKLVIADAFDCQNSSAVFLSAKGIACPANLIPQLSAGNTPLVCGNDATATVTVTNGTGPITYNWQPGGQTTATATGLAPGTYTCTVGFSLPCPYTQTVSTTITSNNALSLSTSSQNAYCAGPTGSASVTVSGGIQPYSVPQWNTSPVQTGNTVTGLVPGTYSVTVSDASSCPPLTASVTVGNTTPSININFSTTQSTCHSPNGSITTNSVSGGTAPYNYSWSTTPPTTTPNLSTIPSGTYSLTVTDAANCTAVKDITVTNVDSVLIDIYALNEYCNHGDGEVHVPVLNGIGPYTWNWSHTSLLNDSIADHLSAGSYSFTVTDNAGCVSSGIASIINIRDVFEGSIYTLPPEPTVNNPFTLGISMPSTWSLDYMEFDDGSVRFGANETTLLYPEYGLYDVNFYVESVNGCKDTIPYGIFVKDFMTIYIPNAFTPNNDKKNREWYVYGTLVKSINIYVYDRWGTKLFESHDLEQGWDGKFKNNPCEEGVYGYKVEATDYFNEEFKFAGHITLIR